MMPATLLDDFKKHVAKVILRGDFLLSTNNFSEVWINAYPAEVQTPLCDLLANFCRRYLAQNASQYLLLGIEQFEETSEKSRFINLIANEAVTRVDSPALAFDMLFVDPDSFEVSFAEHAIDRPLILFVEPSAPHDLLLAVYHNLHALGYTLQAVVTTIERTPGSGATIRNDLHLDFIPFLVYAEQQDQLFTITELTYEPYTRYHAYFV
jgi:hypothetical protein